MISKSSIYLDNNSTTQVDQRVVEVMLPYLTINYFNPNSAHSFGKAILKDVSNSRNQIADIINADPSEIIFTSGSTESINLSLRGFIQNNNIKGRHIITVKTEHSAVLETCKYLETVGFEVTYLDVHEDGLVSIEELEKSIRTDTFLISVMYVNNETGVIQPIKQISEIALANKVYFMCDTTQAIGKIKIDVIDLNIDILCISGHKIHAPKGIGALFLSNKIKKGALMPLIFGGKQESGLRAGTLNVPGIIALAKACEIADLELDENQKRIGKLRTQLEHGLLQIPNSRINGNKYQRVFNVSNICFNGIDANMLIGKLNNIALSNGSACNSLIFQPSHVLNAMGLSECDALSSIRFSLSKYNTENEIIEAIEILTEKLISTSIYA